MATPHPHHHDHHVHDSEDTSDSNEEFASASEGDDDLPWEPVVIRSPIISRQSPVSPVLSEGSGLSQTLRGATVAPKLRERMRQSPVLRSRIVQAYLDPSASQFQRQQQQHASSENVRQAWLQDHRDNNQESSSEEDIEEEQEQGQVQERQTTTPVRPTPAHAPIPAFHQPVPLPPAPVATAASVGSIASSGQHHTHYSWNEASTDDHHDDVQSDQHQEEAAWGFDDTVDIEGEDQPGEQQVEEAWGFDDNVDIEGGAQPEQQAEASWGFDDTTDIEGGAQPGGPAAEAAWGFDDNIQVEEHVQDHPHAEPAHSFNNNAPADEMAHPSTHHDETAWGFDDNVQVDETVQPDLHQVEAAWGFDDHIDIEGGIHAETQSSEDATRHNESIQYDETAQPRREHGESAWGFDDNIQIDKPMQPDQHQAESAWRLGDTIEIVTSTVPDENKQLDSTTGIDERSNVEESSEAEHHHVEASWGFEDKIEMADTTPAEQMESLWGFDESVAVEEAPSEHQSGTADNSATAAEPAYPAMHQAHESDAEAWDYDDQVIELIEEAAAQEIHSASFATSQHDDLSQQDFQESHIGTTGDSFTEHVAMPPSSTTPSAGDYQDENALSEVVDHDQVTEQSNQQEYSHTDATISSEPTHHDNVYHSEETRGIDSAGPSDAVEVAEAEQSWGFDMAGVIGGDDLESAALDGPSLGNFGQEAVQEHYHPDEQHIVPPAVDHQVEPESLVPSTDETTEGVPTAVDVDTEHADQASENEHDSEIREVLFATQHTPAAIPQDIQSTENLPLSIGTRVLSSGSVSFDDSKPFYADAAVTSNLLVKEDAAPSRRSDSRESNGELKHSVSDSEGSDIYGDLSTAYTGRNMSSNRLNELLDDDDYLEHMERGVPMDRSISTPYSDDDSPRFFVMEDDVVELMERGEPQPVDGAPVEQLETLEYEHEVDEDDNQATRSVLEHGIDASNLATSFDPALHVAGDAVSRIVPDPVLDAATILSPHEVETGAVEEEEVAVHSAEVTEVTLEEPEVSSFVETVIDAVSDDRDPANPFSDAAAIDDADLWPAAETVLEKAEMEEPTSEPSVDTHIQESVNAERTSHAIDDSLEDAWADQGLDVVAEPTIDISIPPTHGISDVRTDDKSEVPPVEGTLDQAIVDGLDGDAWGDQDLEITEVSSTIVHSFNESTEGSVYRQKSPAHSALSVEPEQPLVESSIGISVDTEVDGQGDETVVQPAPVDDLKEEVAEADVSKQTTEGISQLQDFDTFGTHFEETTTTSHQVDALTTPKDATLELDAWDNQADTIDLDAALDEDAWAAQDDNFAIETPVVSAMIHQEKSVSDLFADRSDKPSSKPASPLRGFAKFAAYSPISPRDRSVSDMFSEKSEQAYTKPASPVRGFAAFIATSPKSEEPYVKSTSPARGFGAIAATSSSSQRRSVADIFSDTSLQEFGKPTSSASVPVSSTVPVPAPAQDDLLKDAVEEDAWDDQDIHFDEQPLPTTSEPELHAESEPEQKPESATFNTEQSIDDALEGYAWGVDQDGQIDQESVGIVTEPHVDSPNAIVKVQEVHDHFTTTLEQQLESHTTQDTTTAFDSERPIDVAIEDDAWGNQDNVTFDSAIPHKQAFEEIQHDLVHSTPEPIHAKDLPQEDAHKYHEAPAHCLNFARSIDVDIEGDARDNQDDATFGQEFDAPQGHQPLQHSHTPVHSEEVVAKDDHALSAEVVDLDHAIDAAMEEDMWADNDVDDVPQTVDQPEVHTDSAVTSTAETSLAKDSPASNEVQESPYQPVLPSFESPALPTPTDQGAAFDHDKALEDNAWNDQDIDIGLNDVRHGALTQDVSAVTEHETQYHGAEKSEERPSLSSNRIESIIHQTHTKTAAGIVEDAWGWDEDEAGVSLETQKDSTSQDGQDDDHCSPVDTEEAAPVREKTPDTHSPTQVSAVTPDNNLSPLAIQKERLASGTDSSEGEADSATQSPWQDISPASVSKRSEAGMSIGSEFESEYSVRSLDEYGQVFPAFDRLPLHGHDTSAASTEPEAKKGLETATSWTDLKEDDAWTDDLPESGPANSLAESEAPVALTAEIDNSTDIQQLPDISGADSWDFDQDDDLQSESASLFTGLTTVSARASFSRALKTPDMTESRSFGSQSSPQNKTSAFSSMTSSPGQVLSSYQSSIAGSTPVSPSQHQASTPKQEDATVTPAPEVEDDSHLPLAIRQQRARLAARGKPLPPISKYKSTKETSAEQQSTSSLNSASPRLSPAAATSPVSPMLSPTVSANQKYLSPALLKQRERLEKKRAAAAAAAATPLSASRRLTPSDSSLAGQLSSSSTSPASAKPASPLIKEATLPSALKHIVTSPTLVRKSVQLVDRSESSTSPSTFSVEEFGQSTRRRGLSVSSSHSAQASIPSTPVIGEGVVRRSKEGHRPSMFSSSSATTTPTNATISETSESFVGKSSQNDAFRHVSRLSISSSTGSGWDDSIEEEAQENEKKEDSWVEKKGLQIGSMFSSKGGDRKEPVSRPALISSTSSSSFYQQSVPGLDDDAYGESGAKSTVAGSTSVPNSTTTTTKTTSSYLSSKKADDYDPYGPMTSRKAKRSFDEQDRAEANEVVIGRSTLSPGVSLLSPTSGSSMSNRHDHHHHQQSSTSRIGKDITNTTTTTTSSSSGGGFFGGGGGSLVGDISSLLQEKKTPISSSTGFGSSNADSLGSDYDAKKPAPAAPPAAVQQKQQQQSSASNLQKSSSWSFGSWVSSAVAAASEKIDQAYESLDPEYSRMKGRSPMMGNASSGGGDDPDSLSPFKKPGYVVGGSSLALGLASISTTGPGAGPGSGASPMSDGSFAAATLDRHYGRPSTETNAIADHHKNDKDQEREESYASAGTESDSHGHYSEHAHAHHRISHTERDQSLSTRLTRKNVSGR
ncbi:hypothetical protein BGX33_003497 [Mortierella sp. NVP41]|nr:hypothetical protein BGX33_003497 [Mortierella sp. NVP41]